MSDPIVFISTHILKEGRLEDFQDRNREVAAFMESDKPDTVAFLTFFNEESREVTTVHIFQDADAMTAHMEGVGERAKRAAEVLEFHKLEVFGQPHEPVIEMMRKSSEAGVTFQLVPRLLNGYIRLGE